ncbi:hypothetical protein FA15DRAFT_660331 [Coprinopsis marcescibilis]|uniref:Nephrocystin 3-like N-terminal domain-containing protein n=1 Tax=Coprinopsis marcescibilis TaxID=230819 RepID=A0A5C3KFJ7_COPMA|nr:hypothetical protein FA15DRAFT_660331 [Coprinopsis marcescibilis]
MTLRKVGSFDCKLGGRFNFPCLDVTQFNTKGANATIPDVDVTAQLPASERPGSSDQDWSPTQRQYTLVKSSNDSNTGDARIFDSAKNLKIESSTFNAIRVTHIYTAAVPDEVRRKTITWISDINYRDIQDDNLSKRIGNTSDWALSEPLLVEWENSPGGILWGTGMPGAGKTVLALSAIIIDYLRERSRVNKRILVAFAYCRYTDPLPVRAILAALIRQILEDYPETIIFVQPLYEEHELRKTRPSQRELFDVLKVISTSDLFDQRFCSIDGLDEATLDIQFDILDSLSELGFNFLVTSRPLPLLKDNVPEAKFLDIIVRDADIVRLIEEKVGRIATLRKLLEMDGWKQRVLDTILERSSGMFLLASLQIDMLGCCLNIKDLRVALKSLPKGINAMYSATMERMERQNDATTPKKALIWLVHAFSSLKMDDLRHAIATNPPTSYQFDAELLIDEDTLVSLCCGLITFEPENCSKCGIQYKLGNELLESLDYTARDFLEVYLSNYDPNPHKTIASTCTALLLSSGLHDHRGTISWESYHNSIFAQTPLLRYAHEQWTSHAHSCVSIPPDVVDFMHQCRSFPIFKGGRYFDTGSTVHVAIAYNFHTLLEQWIYGASCETPHPPPEFAIRAETESGLTLLTLACSSYGHLEILRLLLAVEGIDASSADGWGTPLIWASLSGHLEAVKLLLQVVSVENLNVRDLNGGTALMYASSNGNTSIVRALLGVQDGASTEDDDATTTLITSGQPYDAPGIDINAVDSGGGSALTLAGFKGNAGVVSILLSVRGIDVNHSHPRYGTALMQASLFGHRAVVELLLQHEAVDIDYTTRDGRTALAWALKWERHTIVEMLRTRGAREPSPEDRILRLVPDREEEDDSLRSQMFQIAGVHRAWVAPIVSAQELLSPGCNRITLISFSPRTIRTQIRGFKDE